MSFADTPGEIVTGQVDLAMMHDSGGPRRVKPMLERLGAKVWDPSKVVVITDHYVPTYDDESRRIIRIARDWVREAGIENFHDEQGICHVVLPERGHLRPGMFAVGGDSHSPTGGARDELLGKRLCHHSGASFAPSTSAMSFHTFWSTSLPPRTVKRSMKRMPE